LGRALRYNFIVGLVAVSAGLAAAGGWKYARASAPVSGPIIILSVDSLRPDHLPAYGYQGIQTPAIDRLAADGVVFERAYAHAPQGLVAHAALLSGRLPFETGVRDDVGFTVKPGERLLAEILRDRGYATGAVVSSFELRKETGIAQGFSFFDDNMSRALPDMSVGEIARDGAASEQVAEWWLDRVRSGRTFLFLQLQEPHKPYRPSSRFPDLSPYDAQIAAADDIIGRLIRYLVTHQLYDQATIVLVAGHGEGLGDHGEQAHGLLVYEEALHIPLIVKQASGQGAGRRVSDIVQQIDLVPTILDLAKAPVPGNLRGRSLKDLLDGSRRGPRTIYSESLFGRQHFGSSPLATVTDGRYRYIDAPQQELYDLVEDPGEQHNLASEPEHAQSLNTLKARLKQIAGNAAPFVPEEVSAADQERFDALGAVGDEAIVPQGPQAAIPIETDPRDIAELVESYRTGVDQGVRRQWVDAIHTLQTILRTRPDSPGVWQHIAVYATRAGRLDQALDAYKRLRTLRPDDASVCLEMTEVLVRLRRLDEAQKQAELAEALASESDAVLRSSVREWLVRIALARKDASEAREQAALARQTDPDLPLAPFVEAMLSHGQGHYEEALPAFEEAIADLEQKGGPPLADLHFYAADTLLHLDRRADAEHELLKELDAFPNNARARSALVEIYQDDGRIAEAANVIADAIRISPTPDGYTLASRLLTTIGNRSQAEALRLESQRLARRK